MLPRSLRSAPWLVLACLACGSSSGTRTTPPPGEAGADGSIPPADGSIPPADGSIPPADGPFACGHSTCAPNQYCVQPCNCGGEPACNPPLDGGGCPSGEVMQGSCCVTTCTEPPPSCMDAPHCGPPAMSRMVNCPCPA